MLFRSAPAGAGGTGGGGLHLHTHKVLHGAHLTGAVALRAGLDHAVGRTAAITLGAVLDSGGGDLLLTAEGGFLKGQFQAGHNVLAPAGCILTGGIGYLLLPVLRALKAGQSIREIGPTWHNSKAGTPMMGGLMFIFGTILCLVGNFPAMSDDSPFYVLALALCFGLIGFLDDFTKVKFHRNLGLTTLQKAMLQMAVSALFLYATYRSGFMDTHLYIPFANVSFQLHPIVYIFFAMFVMVGCVNSVNLNDGIDGLCAGDTLPVMVFFTAASVALGRFDLALLPASLVGGLIAYRSEERR